MFAASILSITPNILKVDVNEDNRQACQFYFCMGYEIIGRDEFDPTGKPFPILHL
ncbi:hypothetical protein [Gallibacterium genomosp. 3]|uniref:hypothetical protein n=1 Tax=Gallibacterium genomosp. 3 TaxID=505345 RepID=UPI0018D470D9|nr:hypothetical protein [Gallibacterium genomosp. 3]